MPKRKRSATRFVVFGDPHFTRQPPESRSANYGEAVLKKIVAISKLADKEAADAAICCGDFFHLKGEVTQREVQDMIEVLLSFQCPVLSIWGNHDARAHTSIPYRAYGTLVKAGAVQDVDLTVGAPARIKDVQIVGRGFQDNYDKDTSMYQLDKAVNPTILVTHGLLVLKPGVVPTDIVEHTKVEDIGHNAAIAVLNGHIHTPQGEQRIDDCLYVCPGGISRTQSSEQDRPVQVCVLSVKDGTANVDKWVDLKVESAKTAFVAGVQSSTSVEDVRKVAATLRPEGGDVLVEAEQAVELAAASMGFGPEVIQDAKRRLRDGDEKHVS